jgi:hypothetical protein
MSAHSLYRRIPTNPHPALAPARLAEIDDRVLADLIVLVASETVSPERRHLAGVPELQDLEAELRRRTIGRITPVQIGDVIVIEIARPSEVAR